MLVILTTTILAEWDSLRGGEERTGGGEEGSIRREEGAEILSRIFLYTIILRLPRGIG